MAYAVTHLDYRDDQPQEQNSKLWQFCETYCNT